MPVKSLAGTMRIGTEKRKDGSRIVTGWAAVWTDTWTGELVTKRYAAGDIEDMFADARLYATQDAVGDVMAERAGKSEKVTAIIAGYDIMYDLAPAWSEIARDYRIEPVAKSPSDIYALKLFDGDDDMVPGIVIWDMKHMTRAGVRGIAESMGTPLDGTPEADAMALMSYMIDCRRRHGLDRELGASILTMTSLAKHEAAETVGKLSYVGGDGREHTLLGDYRATAAREQARTYDEYACRRACNRGGFVFASARTAGKLQGRTIGIDETSAHHAQVMCRWVPEHFKQVPAKWIQGYAGRVVKMNVDEVLAAYHMPFKYFFNALFDFEGLRLRHDSVWESMEIGLEGSARLADVVRVEGIDDEAAVEAERGIRAEGFRDEIEGGQYCFGKVMAARRLRTWLNEIELWNFSRVYEWDRMTVVCGEATAKRRRPDDYAILTSMRFFAGKQELKHRIRATRNRDLRDKLEAIYDGETKPQFNAVGYGLHARDELRPGYEIDRDGSWHLQHAVSPDDYEERRPKRPQAWFSFGSRISTGARMQLIIAAELIWEAYGDAAMIISGDTDSLKVCTELSEEDLLHALDPLHAATRLAIARVTARAATMWPDDYRNMSSVGEFMVEDVFKQCYVPGVKQCAGITYDGALELTLAGVPRSGEWSFAAWLEQMIAHYGPEVLEQVFAFDIRLSPGVSQLSLMTYEKVEEDGVPIMPKAQGVYYTLNDTHSNEARHTVRWQRQHGREVILDPKAYAYWDDRGAVFEYSMGELHSYDRN